MNKDIIGYAALHGGAVALYISGIAFFINNADRWFGRLEDTPAAPVLMLTLFVLSAAITGSLVLGRPLIWFLDGKRREAVALFISTLAVLLLFGAGLAALVLR
ncbi:hypothetical protein HYV30_00735 [Candidatus Kaiserbacteria bacterium]|nr:hypothetical protein [Candidatus Kaiserbacteria bacterium]